MIREFLTMLYGVALALGLGIFSAVWATNQLPLVGLLEIDGWTANPGVGGDQPDAYSQAYFSRSGGLPLAAAEGLTFLRNADDNGNPLDATCLYRISGDTPAARRWTLQVTHDGFPYTIEQPDIPVSMHSHGVLRGANGAFDIRIAPRPQPGNWIYAGPSGPFGLSLTLYDTAVASDTGLRDMHMPSVLRLECFHG
ncbi:MAG: DUF1214 domain-containing protein [Oricola sp.]